MHKGFTWFNQCFKRFLSYHTLTLNHQLFTTDANLAFRGSKCNYIREKKHRLLMYLLAM